MQRQRNHDYLGVELTAVYPSVMEVERKLLARLHYKVMTSWQMIAARIYLPVHVRYAMTRPGMTGLGRCCHVCTLRLKKFGGVEQANETPFRVWNKVVKETTWKEIN